MKKGKDRKERKHDEHSKKKRDKEKKRKKESKKSRKRSTSSSPSSDSDRNQAVGSSALFQLERERAAVQAARYLLTKQPGIRKDFRDLLWELDNGRAVGLSGIPDDVLRSQLQFILQHLGLKCTQGQYWLPSGTSGTLSVIGFVFDEQQSAQRVPQPPPGMITAETAQATTQQQAAGTEPKQPTSSPTATAAATEPSVAKMQQQPPENEQQPMHQSLPQAVVASAAAASPQPQHAEDAKQQQQQEMSPAGVANQAAQAGTDTGPAPRRVVGPAAPSAELLAAAAAYHADMEAAGGYESAAGPEDSSELLIGPPPPEYYTEADAAAADVREQQVVRVLQVLRSAAAEQTSGSSNKLPAGEFAADSYAILGVEPTADSGTIRKTYWRLSLLVHPDKCTHPAAQEVFQAVSKAAQMLQDTQQRKQLDGQREDAQLRQQALAAAAAAEREVAWRKARGEAVPAELAAVLAAAQSAGAGPAVRESWMTDLPTNQGKTAAQALAMGLSQTSQTSFNRFGVRQPGDTSGWTDTPQQRAMRAAGLITDSSTGSPAALPAPSAAVEGTPVTAELAAAMRDYAQQHRQKSLLEQHAERQTQGSKKKHKEQKQQDKETKGQKRKAADSDKPPSSSDADWSGKHPWRPWDRDKDLEVQVQRPKAAADLLKAAGNLSSRFSSGR